MFRSRPRLRTSPAATLNTGSTGSTASPMSFMTWKRSKVISASVRFSVTPEMKAAVDAFAAQPNSASMSPAQAWTDIDRRFNIAYVESVEREHMKIERAGEGRGMQVKISYEVRKPLMFNLDVVGRFEHVADLTGQGSGG